MDPEEQKKLIDRSEKIEALLFDLANRVNQADDPPQQVQTPQPGPYSPPGYAIVTPQPLSPPLDSDDDDKSEYSYKPDPNKEVYQGEFWLNKIGKVVMICTWLLVISGKPSIGRFFSEYEPIPIKASTKSPITDLCLIE